MTTERLTVADAHALAVQVLTAAGTRREVADSVADALVSAECDGQQGHGLARLMAYADQVATGKVAGSAQPTLAQPRPATLFVDAAHGFAFPAIDRAVAGLRDLAPAQGIAAAAIGRSHHFGVAGHPVERLARAGMVAMAFSNSPAAMAPWGGARPIFGTNPIAFAVPRQQADPVVVDLSLSTVARGKVNLAAQRGESIPADWALDADGQPTTDPDRALAGSMRPAGDAKGAALAFMVEVLSVAFTPSNFGFQASSFFAADGPPPGIGQLLIAIAPDGFGDPGFAERLEGLLAAMTADPGVRLSGQRRLARRAQARAEGLDLDAAMLARLRARLT